VTDNIPEEAYEVLRSEAGPLPRQAEDVAFLITASELRVRKTKRRRKDGLLSHFKVIRRLVELGLEPKEK
jgi:hypothetical protein